MLKHFLWSAFGIVLGVFVASFLFNKASFVLSFDKTGEIVPIVSMEDHQSSTSQNPDFKDSQFAKKEDEIILKNLVNEILDSFQNKRKNDGLLMFRGNLSRNFYGFSPVPHNLETKWQFPKKGEKGLCSESVVSGVSSLWCGTGWTGQPVVWERKDGKKEIIFGAYDGAVHFLDAENGKKLRPSFQTGDIIKGSVTLDPDGFPLLYFGSRDNKLRILSLEENSTKELWALDSKELGGMWNNDWDGNPAILDDVMYIGGENGIFYAILLNRNFDQNGFVTVDPKIIFSLESYTKELIEKTDRNVSIENSVAIFKERVYFANSAGRVVGLDISNIKEGVAPIIFDYWVGDDVDATIVIDEEGMLYVSSELERFNERSLKLGQVIKLNPYNQDDPFVWGVKVPKENFSKGGVWATPALYKNNLFVSTHTGRLLQINKESGKVLWEDKIAPHSWSSPLALDDTLLVSTCAGEIRNYTLKNGENPLLSSVFSPSASCIESTMALWKGEIFVGSRDGFFYKLGNVE